MKASLLDLASTPLLQAQRHVLELLVELIQIDHRIYEICESLPLGALYMAMEEGLIPRSGFGNLYILLQQVKGQYLKPAIEALREASQVSNADAIAKGRQ